MIEEIQHEPNQEVVESLENMLKQAKDGHLRSFMAVKILTGGYSGQVWSGLTKNNEATRLLGEVLLLAIQLSISIDGVEAEDINY